MVVFGLGSLFFFFVWVGIFCSLWNQNLIYPDHPLISFKRQSLLLRLS